MKKFLKRFLMLALICVVSTGCGLLGSNKLNESDRTDMLDSNLNMIDDNNFEEEIKKLIIDTEDKQAYIIESIENGNAYVYLAEDVNQFDKYKHVKLSNNLKCYLVSGAISYNNNELEENNTTITKYNIDNYNDDYYSKGTFPVSYLVTNNNEIVQIIINNAHTIHKYD